MLINRISSLSLSLISTPFFAMYLENNYFFFNICWVNSSIETDIPFFSNFTFAQTFFSFCLGFSSVQYSGATQNTHVVLTTPIFVIGLSDSCYCPVSHLDYQSPNAGNHHRPLSLWPVPNAGTRPSLFLCLLLLNNYLPVETNRAHYDWLLYNTDHPADRWMCKDRLSTGSLWC